MMFETRFTFGDRVTIDGDHSVEAVVTGFGFYERAYLVEVAWFSSGSQQVAWIAESRLSSASRPADTSNWRREGRPIPIVK